MLDWLHHLGNGAYAEPAIEFPQQPDRKGTVWPNNHWHSNFRRAFLFGRSGLFLAIFTARRATTALGSTGRGLSSATRFLSCQPSRRTATPLSASKRELLENHNRAVYLIPLLPELSEHILYVHVDSIVTGNCDFWKCLYSWGRVTTVSQKSSIERTTFRNSSSSTGLVT